MSNPSSNPFLCSPRSPLVAEYDEDSELGTEVIGEAEREIREEKEKVASLVREREREKEVEGEVRMGDN